MNKKEAEDIAWEIFKIEDCTQQASGKDCAMDIVNTAIDSIYNIIKNHVKIKIEVDKLRKLYDYDKEGE